MNDDTREVVLRLRLGELAGLARTTPRKLPSAATALPGKAPWPRPTAWRAALLVGSAAVVVGGLVALSQRDRPSVSTNSTVSTTLPEPTTPITAPGSVPPPSTTYVTVNPAPVTDPAGVITYATTLHRNTTWPMLATSGTPAINRGYGMAVCDGSSWTKVASLESNNGPRQTYVGTLCTITTLNEPAPGTVATCAAVTPGVHYARCQRLDDTDTGIAAPHPASPDTTIVGTDATPLGLRVTPSDAYAAFQDGDGPIELVGIVPDDISTSQALSSM